MRQERQWLVQFGANQAHDQGEGVICGRLTQVNGLIQIDGLDQTAVGGVDFGAGLELRNRRGDGGASVDHGMFAKEDDLARRAAGAERRHRLHGLIIASSTAFLIPSSAGKHRVCHFE